MTKLGPVQPPDLSALLNDYRDHMLFRINCHQIGTVVSFNKASQTASVALLVLRVVGDQTVPYPALVDVPVFTYSGGGAVLTMPIAPGDTCLVLFNDRDLDNWFENGATTAPNTDRAHSLADGLAIVGFRSKANPVADFSDTDAQLKKGSTIIGMDGSKIQIYNGSYSLQNVLTNLRSILTSWVNTGGSTPNAATLTALNTWNNQVTNLLK